MRSNVQLKPSEYQSKEQKDPFKFWISPLSPLWTLPVTEYKQNQHTLAKQCCTNQVWRKTWRKPKTS